MKAKFMFILSILCVIISCSNQVNNCEEIVIETNNSYFSRAFSVQKVIKLETSPQSLINVIFKIILTDENIYLLSNNRVLVFDLDGKFVKQFGKLGNGPNEMLKPSDFDLSPDRQKIAIWDNLKREINIFNIDGTYLEKYLPNITMVTNFKWLDENTFLFDSEFQSQNNKQFCIYEFNINSKKEKQKIPYNIEQEGYNVLNYDAFPAIGSSTYFMSSLRNTLFDLSRSTPIPNIKINFGSAQISDEGLSLFKGNTFNLIKEVENSEKCLLMKFYDIQSNYIITYRKGKFLFTNLYSRSSGKQLTINHSNPFDFYSPLIPYSVHEDNIICVAEPSQLIENYKRNGPLVKNGVLSGLETMKKLCSEIKVDDNPIIFLVKPLIK
jgi:hypothetical protein